VTLRPQPQDPRPASAQPAPKPVSEWDRVRQEVRQEKPKPEPAEAPRQPTVADVILKVLADNGHRFGELGANASITVAVTFRAAPRTGWGVSAEPTLGYYPAAKALTELGKTYGSKEGTADSRPPSKAQDYELLGDLHSKQGKYAEALKEYERAMDQKPSWEVAVRLLRKMHEALAAQGKTDEARRVLDKARELQP